MSQQLSLWQFRLRLLAVIGLVAGVIAIQPVTAQTEQSIVCDVGMFKTIINIAIPTILTGFFPIAVTALLGEQLVSSLPFLSQSRRKKFMKWRGKVMGAGAVMYIGLPIVVTLGNNAGFPIPDCITFVPF